MAVEFPFDNSYARLPERFYARVRPVPVIDPQPIRVNTALAQELGLDPQALQTPQGTDVFAGNALPEGAEPIAQAYAGHQFGGFVPTLGDGRAILLGEVIDRAGRRRDIQLKGAGRTPFSRGSSDGRAWLGPVLREYVVSEAMHAMGVPTTRALAAVTTGEPVYRESVLPGAVLTRVASSHIRVGTFQYFVVRDDVEALRTLCEYACNRHFRDASSAEDLLDEAVAAQARLVAHWMGLGFVHGVMNTDNTHVAGETIDYGPCAFLDAFRPGQVFSSVDAEGRYAYGRQPQMAIWNLAQFATCLLPLFDMDEASGVDLATRKVHAFEPLYREAWLTQFGAKLGLARPGPQDQALIEQLLGQMARQEADFTRVFRGLADGTARAEFRDPAGFDDWEEAWKARLAREGATFEQTAAALRRANPAFIPRNHQIESAIQAAIAGDFAPFHRLCEVLARPCTDQPDAADLQQPPRPEEAVNETFCGT